MINLPVWAMSTNDQQRLLTIQQDCECIQYGMPQDQQATAFEKLSMKTSAFVQVRSESAEAWIWSGIVTSGQELRAGRRKEIELLLVEVGVALGEGIHQALSRESYTADWIKDCSSALHPLLSETVDLVIFATKALTVRDASEDRIPGLVMII